MKLDFDASCSLMFSAQDVSGQEIHTRPCVWEVSCYPEPKSQLDLQTHFCFRVRRIDVGLSSKRLWQCVCRVFGFHFLRDPCRDRPQRNSSVKKCVKIYSGAQLSVLFMHVAGGEDSISARLPGQVGIIVTRLSVLLCFGKSDHRIETTRSDFLSVCHTESRCVNHQRFTWFNFRILSFYLLV